LMSVLKPKIMHSSPRTIHTKSEKRRFRYQLSNRMRAKRAIQCPGPSLTLRISVAGSYFVHARKRLKLAQILRCSTTACSG
jgi:hypothetical protein